jgi:hypothetical protein
MLHRIFGHESCPVSFVATFEHGALSLAAREPGNDKRRGDCPVLPIPAAWALCCNLP